MQIPHGVLKKRLRLPSPSMVLSIAALVLAASGGAYAATQIDGHNIQNGSIPATKLDAAAANKLNHAVGQHWGVIDRNTIGSGVADLRAGPYGSFGATGGFASPPHGVGSLGIQVSDNANSGATTPEKVAFGNEVDFYGDPVSGLSQVGFRVFQTQENADINPRNMPNISLEIDPNVGTSNYTSMVWVPDAAPVTNKWTGFLNATTTGDWYFTGAAGTVTGCNQTTMCSFSAAQSALVTFNNASGPATIDTIAVAKGRDNTWAGAVDNLRINSQVFDFEPYGVRTLNG
ncbi:MAG: hypothetical protein ACRDMH_09985 [Solirubrobacterales bacterium]